MEMDASFYGDGQYAYAPAYNDGLDSFYTHPAPFVRQPVCEHRITRAFISKPFPYLSSTTSSTLLHYPKIWSNRPPTRILSLHHLNYANSSKQEANPFAPPSLLQVCVYQYLFVLVQFTNETLATVDLNLPDECQGYHSFVPLEAAGGSGTSNERRKLGNWYSTVYRAIRASDGRPYALRRVESKKEDVLSS